MAALNGYHNQTGPAVHRRENKLFKLLKDYPQNKRNTIMRSYMKFMFVREPFERLLSAYKSKFMGKDQYIVQKYGRQIIRLFRKKTALATEQSGDDVTFLEFIKYVILLGTNQHRFNEHWRTYESLCRPCDIHYNFIGHYESLREDVSYVLRETRVQDLVSFPPFRPTNTTRELLLYYSKIPRDALLQLKRVYQRDLALFGYEFPGPLQSLFRTAAQTSENKIN